MRIKHRIAFISIALLACPTALPATLDVSKLNKTSSSEIEQKHTLKPTPFEVWSTIPASALGLGHHKVELYVDGTLYDTQEFEVQETRPEGA